MSHEVERYAFECAYNLHAGDSDASIKANYVDLCQQLPLLIVRAGTGNAIAWLLGLAASKEKPTKKPPARATAAALLLNDILGESNLKDLAGVADRDAARVLTYFYGKETPTIARVRWERAVLDVVVPLRRFSQALATKDVRVLAAVGP